MKRSRLKPRKKPLGLGPYPLQRMAGALIQQEFERRKALKRKPLRKKGARADREEDALARFRRDVLENAGGRCQRCGHLPEGPWARPLEAHHRLPRSRGGTHRPANGAALCGGPQGCHLAVHDHVALDWKDWIIQTKPGS